jgi:hypothetical protein
MTTLAMVAELERKERQNRRPGSLYVTAQTMAGPTRTATSSQDREDETDWVKGAIDAKDALFGW